MLTSLRVLKHKMRKSSCEKKTIWPKEWSMEPLSSHVKEDRSLSIWGSQMKDDRLGNEGNLRGRSRTEVGFIGP